MSNANVIEMPHHCRNGQGVQIIPWLRMLQNLRLNLVLECSTVIWRRRAFVSLVVRGQVRNSINFHRFYYYQAKTKSPHYAGFLMSVGQEALW